MWYTRELVNDFFGFLSGPEVPALYLGGCLENWIEFGNIVDLTGGDFNCYQAAVIQILLAFDRSEELSRSFEKPLINLNDPVAACLERGFWDAAVFRRKYGDRRESEDNDTTTRPAPTPCAGG